MTTPEILGVAHRSRTSTTDARPGGAPGSTRGLDSPFDPAALALLDEGLRRLRAPS